MIFFKILILHNDVNRQMLIILFCEQFIHLYVAMIEDVWEAEEPRSGLEGGRDSPYAKFQCTMGNGNKGTNPAPPPPVIFVNGQ